MNSCQPFYEYDMFGYTVGLYFNGKTKRGTFFGLLISLIYIFCFIGVSLYYINDILSKKNYTLSSSTTELEDTVSVILSEDRFALNFALQNPITFNEYIDETIYYIKANYILGIRDPKTLDFSWFYEKIKTGPCTSDMFSDKNQHFFRDGYKNKYCLYNINNKNLTGNFIFDYYSRIVVSFYPCINSTENNNHCKSKDIIDYYLNNTYIGIYLQSVTINEKQTPMIRNYIESPFTTIGQNFYRDYQVFLKIVETEEDNNILFSTKKFKKALQFDYTKEMSTINPKVNDNSFCDMTIKLSDKKTVYKRSCDKLSNASFKAGGIMSGIYYIIKICLWFPVKAVYEINALNNVFKFDMTKIIKKKNDKNTRRVSNFNSDSQILKSKNKKSNIKILKIKNDEDIKNNSKEIPNQEFLYFKKNHDLNLKAQNIKDMQSESSINNIYNKNISNNNFLIKNINNQKKLSQNNLSNNLRENMEKEIIDYKKNLNEHNGKYIVDSIKIKWYQLLCYYQVRHCSNNIKLILVENGRKFFMKNLDVINIFQSVMMRKKFFDYILTNRRIFGLLSSSSISYNDKPIISDNKFDCN